MRFTLSAGMPSLARVKDALQSAWELSAEEGVDIIVDRTRAGRTPSGAAFKGYSSGYKKTRQKEGLSTKPNLSRTGQLLQHVQVLGVAPLGASIGVVGAHGDISNATLVEYLEVKRPFLDITSKAELQRIERAWLATFLGELR